MVTFFGFLQFVEIIIQHGFFGERSSIYPLQHRIFFAAPPVSSGQTHQFNGLQFSSRGNMRPGAEIHKLSLLIYADSRFFRQSLYQLYFKILITGLKVSQGLFPTQLFADKGIISFNYGADFLLNQSKIIRGKGMGAVKIIIETPVNSRADSQFGFRPQTLYGLSHNVG